MKARIRIWKESRPDGEWHATIPSHGCATYNFDTAEAAHTFIREMRLRLDPAFRRQERLAREVAERYENWRKRLERARHEPQSCKTTQLVS